MRNFNIADGLISYQYGCTKYDELLNNDDNIGIYGENLTIVILSCNRSKATIKLLDSISNILVGYLGKVVIADNNSSKQEKEALKKYISKSTLNINLIEFDKNYGVAGGRNKIINYIDTDWIFNLDNDIYFIKNPIAIIQKTIAQLGVKFLNLPLLSEDNETVFANGGTLHVNYLNNVKSIGGGSMYEQSKITDDNCNPSLSTFLFGGASILNKQTFIECGMFDDNMFVGFEDIDFSICIFNRGLKIGNCPTFSLVHDHTIEVNENSLEYEKIRFNKGILKESATYFENKWDCKVWDANMEMWLEQRQKDLRIFDKRQEQKVENKLIIKPKIALVVDVEGWCFWNIAQELKKYLSDFYDFEIIPLDNIENNIVKLFFYIRNFDLVHFFWRSQLSLLENCDDYLRSCGLDYDWFKSIYMDNKVITTCVYDHLYLDDLQFTNSLLKNCNTYYVSSSKLLDIYNKNENIIKKPFTLITDGIDLELFKPMNLNRFDKNDKLTIGWVGNSAWSAEIEDFKGFNTILKPVVDELIEEGYPLKPLYADRQIKMIPHEKMPEYYSKIDVCVCVSKMEGTPNPVLEAMACGVPIITTDVGIVNEALGNKQKRFILKERNKDNLKSKILELLNNRGILKQLSEENLKSIKQWDWKNITKEFKLFFDENLKNK